MKKIAIVALLWAVALSVIAQKDAYTVYDKEGNRVNYDSIVLSAQNYDIVLFGELHNNTIAHWLQYELTADLHSDGASLILGAEMIEADDQPHLDRYVSGEITYAQLDSVARLWSNHKTDYAPLVDFAKDHKLTFVGTNIPRRYANRVYRGGFAVLDTLSDLEKSWMAPLPMAFDPELPTYKSILADMGPHGSPELVMAQATKDATMAHFILKNWKEGSLFLHYNGRYHSDRYEGILWYLRRERPELRYMTITTISQDDIYQLEDQYLGVADYIICVDSDMTTTY